MPHVNLAETERRRQDDDAILLDRQLRQHTAVAHSVFSQVSAIANALYKTHSILKITLLSSNTEDF